MTFGQVIREARKEGRFRLAEIAARVKKENGESITAQYLNDLEHDRRNPPPPLMIDQLASALNLNADLLYHLAGKIPSDLLAVQADRELIIKAYKNFRKQLSTRKAAA